MTVAGAAAEEELGVVVVEADVEVLAGGWVAVVLLVAGVDLVPVPLPLDGRESTARNPPAFSAVDFALADRVVVVPDAAA